VVRHESEHKAARQNRKNVQLVAQGAPGGGTRPFGLSDVQHCADGPPYREEVKAEADAIREAARDIVAGTTMKAICRRWEAQGLRGTPGRPFSLQVVSNIMTAEWVVGRRAGRPAQWPRILDEDTWRLVGAVIKGRATGRAYPRTLLSGIAVCAPCGHTLASRPKADGKPAYVCATDLGGCGKIRVVAAGFEEDVLERLFSRIDPEQLHSERADDPTAEAMAEMARLEGVKKQLAELAGAGELDITEFRAARAANEQKMKALRETVAKSADQEALERTRAEALDLRAKWDDLDIDSRRQLVQALAERIEVGPAVRGRNFYSRDRVKVTYR
jgi:hypothetical protein